MGPAERRSRLLRILCRRRHETMVNLAKELEVSKRTIRRDVAVLSEVEPIYTRSGCNGGGVYVVDGYYSERLFLTEREITTLKVILTYFRLHPKDISDEDLGVLHKIIQNYAKPESEKERKRK